MKLIPLNGETEPMARRIVWFEPSAKALADPRRWVVERTPAWPNQCST